jgi:hypothetical protein
MPQVGFEPMIPLFERAKTVHALDRAVTVVGIGDLHRSFDKRLQIKFPFLRYNPILYEDGIEVTYFLINSRSYKILMSEYGLYKHLFRACLYGDYLRKYNEIYSGSTQYNISSCNNRFVFVINKQSQRDIYIK